MPAFQVARIVAAIGGARWAVVATDQLKPEHPDGNDGADHGDAADGPSREIGRTILIGPIDHGVIPVVHPRLLSVHHL